MLEGIDDLIEFTGIQSIAEGEVFVQPDITSTYVKPMARTEDIYQPINKHGAGLLGDGKSPAIIKTIYKNDDKQQIY